MSNTKPRKILVTGASRGIGAAIARRLLALGHRVIGISRNMSTWKDIPTSGMESIELDLVDLDNLPKRLQAIAKSHPDLDGLVLNAGIGRFASLEEFSFAQIREQLDINLTQHIFVTRALLPVLKRQTHSDLIFMGSEAALAGGRKGALYCACKFALRGLAQSLRQECATSGVRVSLLNPGMVATDFFAGFDFAPGPDPTNHLRPEDVAEAVALIISAHPGTVFDEITLNPLKRVIEFKR